MLKTKHTVKDIGCASEGSCDYPDFASRAAEAVSKRLYDRGILVCGSGVGMSIVANRYGGVRAALVWNADIARLSREHNDANILCLPGRFIKEDEAEKIIEIWLSADFIGKHHANRLEKISRLEKTLCK